MGQWGRCLDAAATEHIWWEKCQLLIEFKGYTTAGFRKRVHFLDKISTKEAGTILVASLPRPAIHAVEVKYL